LANKRHIKEREEGKRWGKAPRGTAQLALATLCLSCWHRDRRMDTVNDIAPWGVPG